MKFYLIYLLNEIFMKTNKRLLENTENYRKTLKWVITNIYNHQKGRSEKKWFNLIGNLMTNFFFADSINFIIFCLRSSLITYWPVLFLLV